MTSTDAPPSTYILLTKYPSTSASTINVSSETSSVETRGKGPSPFDFLFPSAEHPLSDGSIFLTLVLSLTVFLTGSNHSCDGPFLGDSHTIYPCCHPSGAFSMRLGGNSRNRILVARISFEGLVSESRLRTGATRVCREALEPSPSWPVEGLLEHATPYWHRPFSRVGCTGRGCRRNKSDLIRLDFEEEGTGARDNRIVKGKDVVDDDLKKPFKEALKTPLTRRIIESMFEREKLFGANFNDWFRSLKLVLRVEKNIFVIEYPVPPAPPANSAVHVLAEWNVIYDVYNEELKSMFEKQAGVERFDLIQTFHAYKQEEGKQVGPYVIKIKGYVEQLERLGYVLPQDLSVGLILNGLTSDFAGFVKNYNMHNMGKTIGELHALLIEYEKGLPKKVVTPQGKDKLVYIPKPKNPIPSAKEHLAKDDACHHCKEVGNWKRNYLVYLVELIKKKKQVGTASSSDMFTI
ncbi:hypothetical protein Tco_0794351 [Tanacetum coccineum]